jgi:hypothetical protein
MLGTVAQFKKAIISGRENVENIRKWDWMVEGKWPYFIMNYLDYSLQRKTTNGNVPETVNSTGFILPATAN